MKYKKENLLKLLQLIEEISNEPENEWFKKELLSKYIQKETSNVNIRHMDEIYEHCLRKIIKEHAEKFYSNFKLSDIKEKLIEDFVRMEKFRRSNNFEDFCLATFQQLESIVNKLVSNPELINYFRENKDLPAILQYDRVNRTFIRRGNLTVGKLIFLTSDINKINGYTRGSIQDWFFNHKLRAVLYFYYFNKEIKVNTDLFDRVYEIGNFLYQGRNLNHRGAVQSPYQQSIIDDLVPNQHKYYFKFLGFLEDFISSINKQI